MGNKLLTQNFNTYPEHNKYAQIDKGSQNQWLDPNIQKSLQSQWNNVTDQNLYYRPEYGKFTLFRNKLTFQEVEKYKIVLKDREHFNRFSLLTKWRNNCQYLPKVQHFMIENKTQICVSRFQVSLFTQRIPLRLADLADIPFPQNLYFMTAILKGYKYIFGSNFSVKMFKPTQSMVGVSRQGEVKVWWSENFSSLEAEESRQVFISEQDFVRQIIEMVQQNSDQRQYCLPLKKYLSERNIGINGDFNFMISQIYNYAKQMKVIIPKYAFSVREILTRDMFENTKLYSQNSQNSNDFKITNKHIEKDQIGKIQYSGQNFIKRYSNQNLLAPFNSENGISNNIQISPCFKNNQGPITNLTNNPQLKPNPIEFAHFNRNQMHQRNKEIKINSGVYHNRPYLLPMTQQPNFSINSNYSFNKLGRNVIQFANNTNLPNHNIVFPQQQKHSDILANKIIFNSNPVKFNNNPSLMGNVGPIKLSPQKFSDIVFHHNNQQNSASYSLSKNSHHVDSFIPSINSQIAPLSRNRHNSYLIPSTYQNQINPQMSNLIHQHSTPIFPEPVRPNQLSTKVQIERVNRAPSSISQHSHNNKLQQPPKLFSQQNNNKISFINSTNNLNQNNSNESQIMKLRYFTKKDSQQSLDPQIIADLVKYLDH